MLKKGNFKIQTEKKEGAEGMGGAGQELEGLTFLNPRDLNLLGLVLNVSFGTGVCACFRGEGLWLSSGLQLGSMPPKLKNHRSKRPAIRLANHLHPKHDLN